MNPTPFTSLTEVSTSSTTDLADLVFNPKSVALIGATDNPSKLISYRPIDYLKKFGYQGAIYPVNPTRDEVQGLRSYASILDTPTAPEFVIIALPREKVLAALDQSAEAGARVAVVYSSGFSEVPDGVNLHQEIQAFTARTGVRVIGPNCQGVANLTSGFFPSFSTTFSGKSPQRGRSAVISQSGAMAGMIYNEWRRVGGGVSYWASTGNEVDVTVAELSRSVIEYEDVETLFLYLESVRDPGHLASLAERARELDKHVMVFRPAQTMAGWQAAGRHTGAGALDDDVASTRLPAGSHFHQVQSIQDLIGQAQIARSGKAPLARSICIISNSGGLGVATADAAVHRGFSIEPLSPVTKSALETVLPGFASTENPVDVTAQLLNDPGLLATALPAMLKDHDVDASIVSLGAVGDGYEVERIIQDIVSAHQESPKPIVTVWMGSNVDVRAALGKQGVPVYTRIEDAVDALGAFAPKGTVSERRDGPPSPTYDDLFVGATYRGGPLTLASDDLDVYAAAARQSDDGINVHSSRQAAIAAGYPGRVVSGLHTLTTLTMIGDSIGLWKHSNVLAGYENVRFTKPLIEGTDVCMELTVTNLKRLSESRGLVAFDFAVVTDNEALARGTVNYVFDGKGGTS